MKTIAPPLRRLRTRALTTTIIVEAVLAAAWYLVVLVVVRPRLDKGVVLFLVGIALTWFFQLLCAAMVVLVIQDVVIGRARHMEEKFDAFIQILVKTDADGKR